MNQVLSITNGDVLGGKTRGCLHQNNPVFWLHTDFLQQINILIQQIYTTEDTVRVISTTSVFFFFFYIRFYDLDLWIIS